MKLFAAILFFLIVVPAHASYYRNVCSSADATVRWEDSHNDATIYFTITNHETGEVKTVKFSVHDVNIRFLSKKNIRGTSNSMDHHFWGKVRITPAPEIREEFRKWFKRGKTERLVICHYHVS